MIFTIEALDASEGDCLLVHHGTPDDPAHTLIDGGPARTYNRALAPRLRDLRAALGRGDRDPLTLTLVVLTHIDDDHVAGLLKLFEALADARDARQPALVDVAELWHNAFDDLVGRDQVEAALRYLERLPVDDPHGTVAGTRQGRDLRDLARRLGVVVNAPFGGLVARPDDAAIVVDHLDLRLTVLGPTRAELDAYQARWDRDLREGGLAGAGLDTSVFNLSSIMLLAESDGRRALLSGDGRGDHLLAGLLAAGRLDADDPASTFHVDVFKLPHHGSARNVTPELLRRVTADTYIISANGKHDNPDVETLDMLAEARGDAPYTLACTFPDEAYKDVDPDADAKRYQALRAVDRWLRARPDGRPTVVYRDRDELGVRVELGDDPAL